MDIEAPDIDDFTRNIHQLVLPLRLGGFGITLWVEPAARAACMSAAAMADLALQDGPTHFHTFGGSVTDQTDALDDLFDSVWATTLRSKLQEAGTSHHKRLGVATRLQSTVRAAAAESMLHELRELFPADTPEGTHARARLLSAGCRPAGMFLDTLPTAHSLLLADQDFRDACRLRLGITSSFPDAPPVKCQCGQWLGSGLRGDCEHAMTCCWTRAEQKMRHDMLCDAVRRIAQRAGLALSREPHLNRICHGSTRTAAVT